MKQLNENWFAITLTAVIFGLLGFVIGKQENKGSVNMRKFDAKTIESQMMMLDTDSNVEVVIDTINGEKQVKVTVIKTDKK